MRKILIIDDHDDLGTALRVTFNALAHQVTVFDNRSEAVEVSDLGEFDLVITDLDNVDHCIGMNLNGNTPAVLPSNVSLASEDEVIKAFKISAANYSRENFDETELLELFAIILDFKARHVDKTESIQNVREKIEFELPSAIGLMHVVLDYLMKRTEKVGVCDVEGSNLFVALDEAFVNAVKHGNHFDPNKLVRVTADVSTKEVSFAVEDEGDGFNVAEIPDPLDPQNLFKTSGRGVLLIHNIMDEVKYNERGNRLTMVKKKDGREPAAES
jgi:serine/threonine-protein kinase RsbW